MSTFSQAYFSWGWIVLAVVGFLVGVWCARGEGRSVFFAGWMAVVFACGFAAVAGKW